MKYVLLIAVLIGGCNIHSPDTPRTPGQPALGDALLIARDIADCSVRIEVADGCGSGTVIQQDNLCAYILTCAHVIEGHMLATVSQRRQVFPNEEPVNLVSPGVVVWFNPNTDLALIFTLPIWPSVATVVAEDEVDSLHLFMPVWMYGFPRGIREGHLTVGHISSWNDMGDMRISAEIYFGNSGCGIFARIGARFVLIGVAQAVHSSGFDTITHMGLGILPKHIHDALKSLTHAASTPQE